MFFLEKLDPIIFEALAKHVEHNLKIRIRKDGSFIMFCTDCREDIVVFYVKEEKKKFIKCIHCGLEIEVLDKDREIREIYCPECGYTNEFDDIRIEFEEREF